MANLVNYRLRVTMSDSRVLTGQMLAFDKHMNLVLADCEEFRKVKSKAKSNNPTEQEMKRTLGLVILRGETIISISIDGPPPPSIDDARARGASLLAGTGIGRVRINKKNLADVFCTVTYFFVLAYGSWYACCSSTIRWSHDRPRRSCSWRWWSCSWCKYNKWFCTRIYSWCHFYR